MAWCFASEKNLSFFCIPIKTYKIMNKRILQFTLLIISLVIYSTGVFSQVVNIEKKRKGDKDGFAGLLGFGFNLTHPS